MSESDITVEIRDLHKTFYVYPDLVRARLKQGIFFWRKYYQEKHVLRGIDLQFRAGELVGLVGSNGAGKTTLLKIIAGISFPTSGHVRRNGRVIAILAHGLGFHPRMTGLQNLELGGMVMGMSLREVRSRRDWIVDFSGLGDNIDRPMTTYSEGMRARLFFSLASCFAPEVLIIDEALARGDLSFVQKCFQRMREVAHEGTTVIYVSHNLWSVQRLATRGLLLENGTISKEGDVSEIVDRYFQTITETGGTHGVTAAYASTEYADDGVLRLERAALLDMNGKPTDLLRTGEPARMEFEVFCERPLSDVGFHIRCVRKDGIVAFEQGSQVAVTLADNAPVFSLNKGKNKLVIEYDPVLLMSGDYHLKLGVFNVAAVITGLAGTQYLYNPDLLRFSVRSGDAREEGGEVYRQPCRFYRQDS